MRAQSEMLSAPKQIGWCLELPETELHKRKKKNLARAQSERLFSGSIVVRLEISYAKSVFS